MNPHGITDPRIAFRTDNPYPCGVSTIRPAIALVMDEFGKVSQTDWDSTYGPELGA